MPLTGSQGSVEFATRDGTKVAIKSSKYSHLELEAQVLKQIANECPEVADHFPKFVDFAEGKLTMSKIDDCVEFSSLINKLESRLLPKRSGQIVTHLCCITLCALEVVRRKTGIVHNDLHTSNVLITKTDKASVSFEFEKRYTFKTFGYFPVIIDFGYAHYEGGITGSLQNSNIGYTMETQDLLADARLLLRTADCSRYIVREIFKPLQLDKHGWFPEYTFTNVYDELYDIAWLKSSKTMDSVFTTIINMMGDLTTNTSAQCCESCYFTHKLENIVFSDDETEFTDEEDSPRTAKMKEYYAAENHTFICECHQKAKEVLNEVYNSRSNLNDELGEKAATILKPFVTAALAHNRAIKEDLYAKLSVRNTMDVIDQLYG